MVKMNEKTCKAICNMLAQNLGWDFTKFIPYERGHKVLCFANDYEFTMLMSRWSYIICSNDSLTPYTDCLKTMLALNATARTIKQHIAGVFGKRSRSYEALAIEADLKVVE